MSSIVDEYNIKADNKKKLQLKLSKEKLSKSMKLFFIKNNMGYRINYCCA